MRAERRSGFRCGSSGDVATAYGDVDSAMISQRDDRESLTCKRLCDSMGNSKRSVVGCHVLCEVAVSSFRRGTSRLIEFDQW